MSFYRHYKGGIYELLHQDATHSETQEAMVVYRSARDRKVWVCPQKEFNGNTVLSANLSTVVKRFVEMQRAPDMQCPFCPCDDLFTADSYYICDSCDRVFQQIK